MPYEPTTNFKDSNNVDLGKKLVTKDYLLSVYETILENSPASGLVVTPALWIWGSDNFTGRLGTNTGSALTPVTTTAGGTNWKQVSCGPDHTGAIKTDGSLWTWGIGNQGHLGTNDTTNRGTPVTTFAGGNDWKQVSCGKASTAAIKNDGSLWVWGRGVEGQLGTNNIITRSTPVTTFAGGNNWKQVFMADSGGGDAHTVAIKTDGSLWTWGDNDAGQLGISNTVRRSTPVTTFVGGNDWKSVSGGRGHTGAVKTNGTLWVWGGNNGGRLGINQGDFETRNTPVTTFAGGTNWKQIVCGGGGSMIAIKTDGSLWTWGYNDQGQGGINVSSSFIRTPVTTFAGGTNWKSVGGGYKYNTAIKTDGSLWTWGHNNSGQLGDTTTTNRLTPVTTFAGGNDWKSVAGGNAHMAAIKSIDYI